MKKVINFSIFLIGFTAMSAQIVLLRQLIIVFYGNEICVAVILGAWLFWGAVGSWLLGGLSEKIKNRQLIFAVLQMLLAVALSAVILVIRSAKHLFGISPGEIIGFLPMAALSFSTLSLTCLILGFLFALACRIYPQNKDGAVQIGRVYLLEGLGAVCGGCVVSLILIRYFDGFYIMLGLSLLNLISAYLLLRQIKQTKAVLFSRALSFALVVLIVGALSSQKAKKLNQASIAKQWQPFQILSSQDSIYSNLVVSQDDSQYTFFSNGLLLFSLPDKQTSEEAVHFALLQSPQPKAVLLLGGGVAGLAEEALKHPIQRLDYLELDAKIIELAKRHLPEEKLVFLQDPRLNLNHLDARYFIKRYLLLPAKGAGYDNIIANLGQPYTAQLNRFYTLEFFQQVKQALKPQGVFSFGLAASENFLNTEQEWFLASIYNTLKSVFKEVKVLPGETVYFLAANKPGLLSNDYAQLILCLDQRNINTQFIREHYLFDKLSLPRIAYLEQRISKNPRAKINSDFHPISYYYDMLLWGAYFAQPWRKIFSEVSPLRLWLFFTIVYLAILFFGLTKRKKSHSPATRSVNLAVFTTGFTELAFQVVILLSFQIIYGYLYYKLGIILSLFMVGLVSGSWLITARLRRLKDDYGLLIKTQAVIAVYPLILPLIFFVFNKTAGSYPLNWLGSNIVFPALPIIAGFMGGFQFPLANKIILKDNYLLAEAAGLSYGLDLLGSCLGALLVSAFLVPLLGISQTCLVLALLNCAVLAALIINK